MRDLAVASSVFSYFVGSGTWHGEKAFSASEFQTNSTQTVADRADIVNSARFYGKLDKSMTVDLTPFANQVGNTTNLLDFHNAMVFLHGGTSTKRPSAGGHQRGVGRHATPTAKAQAALYVVLTSGEYQIIQ